MNNPHKKVQSFKLKVLFSVTMATKQKSLAEVNGLEWEAFVELLGNVVEHNPLCAAAVYDCRPFSSVEALQASFAEFLDSLPTKGKLLMLQRHARETRDLSPKRQDCVKSLEISYIEEIILLSFSGPFNCWHLFCHKTVRYRN